MQFANLKMTTFRCFQRKLSISTKPFKIASQTWLVVLLSRESTEQEPTHTFWLHGRKQSWRKMKALLLRRPGIHPFLPRPMYTRMVGGGGWVLIHRYIWNTVLMLSLKDFHPKKPSHSTCWLNPLQFRLSAKLRKQDCGLGEEHMRRLATRATRSQLQLVQYELSICQNKF